MQRALPALTLLLLAAAGDPPPGATTCSGCHPPTGSVSRITPINGRDAVDLDARMEAFRSTERPSTVMGRLMKGFSPGEIRDIAAWIAAQK